MAPQDRSDKWLRRFYVGLRLALSTRVEENSDEHRHIDRQVDINEDKEKLRLGHRQIGRQTDRQTGKTQTNK